MNTTKLVICTLVGAVFVFLLDYVFYGVLMNTGGSEEMPNFLWMGLGWIIFSLFFCLIYSKWQSGGSATSEGLRYGVMIGFLVGVALSFVFYSLSGMEGFSAWGDLGTVMRDAVYEVVKYGLLGIIVAHLSGLHITADRGPTGKDSGGDPMPPPPPESGGAN